MRQFTFYKIQINYLNSTFLLLFLCDSKSTIQILFNFNSKFQILYHCQESIRGSLAYGLQWVLATIFKSGPLIFSSLPPLLCSYVNSTNATGVHNNISYAYSSTCIFFAKCSIVCRSIATLFIICRHVKTGYNFLYNFKNEG